MKNTYIASLLICNLLLLTCGSACLKLTVNVHFPETAVQQATDSYVHDLYKQKDKARPARLETPAETEPSAKPSESAPQSSDSHFDLISSAHAGNSSSFKLNSANAMRIREKLINNVSDIITHKKAGILGETNDGKLVIQAPEKLKALLKKKVEKLVEDENSAREELYQEVVVSNRFSSSDLSHVKKSFAHSFQNESPGGTWIQDEKGNWSQK